MLNPVSNRGRSIGIRRPTILLGAAARSPRRAALVATAECIGPATAAVTIGMADVGVRYGSWTPSPG